MCKKCTFVGLISISTRSILEHVAGDNKNKVVTKGVWAKNAQTDSDRKELMIELVTYMIIREDTQ